MKVSVNGGAESGGSGGKWWKVVESGGKCEEW
jgi:hypothetical protein